MCQPFFGRRQVTKVQSGLPFCHPGHFPEDFSPFFCTDKKVYYICIPIRPFDGHTVDVAQSVRASDCGSEGRGFEPHLPPEKVFERRPFLLADSRKSAQTILYINDMRNYFVFRPLIKRSEQLIGREMQKIGQVFAAAN